MFWLKGSIAVDGKFRAEGVDNGHKRVYGEELGIQLKNTEKRYEDRIYKSWSLTKENLWNFTIEE